jgi:tetratricopeptide (TPR) repeat protein
MSEPPGEQPIPIPDPAAAAEAIRLVHEARELWERGNLPDSEAPLRRALELAEGRLGPDHPHVSVVLSHLGWLAKAREQNEEAVAAYRRALVIREAWFGPGHHDTLAAMEDLAAALFQAQARDEEADALALRAIAGHEVAGRDDAGLAGLIATVAYRRFWIGRYAEAEPLYLRALAIQERLLGPGDPATAETAQRLAVMYDTRGFDVDPLPYYRKALAGFELSRGDDYPDTFEARYRLATCLRLRGLDHDAAPLFEQLVAALGAEDGAVDLDSVHWMLGECCQYLRDASREAEAEAIEERASTHDPFLQMARSEAERAEVAFGPDSPELAEALGHLAGAYAINGRADQAEDAARRVLAIRQARLGPDDPATVEAAAHLAGIRDFTESFAANRPARRPLGRLDEEKLFDPFSRPWADERRPDLIRAYFASFDEPDEDDPTGAVQAIVALSFAAGLDEQWGVIRELIAEAPDEDRVLQALAAGPLDGFLGRFDGEAIDRVEDEAGRDPRFRRVLTGVWKHGMSDPVWARVRALQATEPDPLPEIRPFAPGDGPPTDPEER